VASERLKLLQRAIEVTFKRHRSEPQRAIEASFVKGHDFSHAAKRQENGPGFSPCHIS